ncbi:hypothetical protein PR202_ga14934 [Eleusine coracana subsp. coracana]|uniref:NB-ARC domain-containing protein n=1 Tax=Eleusine coracana subsp. coracana TaxID=191504 RepID=A0AAV5CIG8_ELECO|nr:hypothetical protein PR202_ga14934 [Eleusine coracana subsp. coracana]
MGEQQGGSGARIRDELDGGATWVRERDSSEREERRHEARRSYISSQHNWNSEVMSELKNLEATLMEIHLAVNMAQRPALVERNQVALLRQVKEAVCYAEDMLDEFDYILLKEKVEHQGMVTHIASSSLSLMKRVIGLDKLRSKLRKVTESVTRLRACVKMFVKVIAVDNTKCFLSAERDLESMERSTGSLLHEDSIFGRKEEVDELVSVLLKACDASSPNSRGSLLTEVHTVVGIGGMGKTTVAQLIYNDERIADAFDLRMWVSVSRNFDKINLMKEIITHTAGGKNIELANFNFSMLQEQLKWRISGKRFLLVLDDVWYDENFGEHINKERWREVIAPMESAHVGSKILVTTRMELVAKMLDSGSLFFLQGLGQDASWLLFKKCAYKLKHMMALGGKVKTIGGQFDLLESINKLTNLVHVTVEKAYVLMLSSTHNLPSVECAGEFHVDKAEGSLLGLRDLNILRGQLAIMSLDKIKCREEAYKGHLHLKKHVTKLELQWGSCKCASDTSWGFEVLDALKPHPDLEELTISGYPGARSPSWLDSGWLSRVQLICLRDCRRWETTLKELTIESCDALPSLADLCGLVSLIKMRITRCSNFALLPNMDSFYSLRVLMIEHCPQLTSLPRSGLPVSLEAFVLHGCHPALNEQFQLKEGPDWDKVAALPGCIYSEQRGILSC